MEICDKCNHNSVCGYRDDATLACNHLQKEVVRCKDCKHRREEFCFHENWWNDDGFTAVCENDFCAYGERKDNEC